MPLLSRWSPWGALLFAAALLAAPPVPAQTESGEQAKPETRRRESVEIKAYDGPPIFLPAVEAPPAPTVTTTRTITENFPDKETVRFERRVAQMSDNTIVSDGPQKEYYSSGQLYVSGQYDMGKPDGTWTYYHENGQVAKEISFNDGKPDGEVRVLDDQGKLQRVRHYASGARDGLWVTYAEGGEQPLIEQRYSGGQPDGVWTTYFSNGQKRQEGAFENGKREGVTTEWAQTGEKRGEVRFSAGVRDGETTIWQRDGRVIKRVYEEGKLVDQQIVDAEG